jgi:hypothetical protein
LKYEAKSFSVPASAGDATICAEKGHAMPDRKGKCIRCGEQVPTFEQAFSQAWAELCKARHEMPKYANLTPNAR